MKKFIFFLLPFVLFYNLSLSQNNAQFVSQSVPTTVEAGEIFDVSVAYKNTGTTTWTEGAYFLGSQNPQDNDIFGYGSGRFPVPFDIQPGQTVSFNATLTAPSTPGDYHFQRRMVQENVEWFGEYSDDIVIHVVENSNASNINFTTLPLDYQLVGRDTNTNMGTVVIAGEVDNNVVNYDQIIVEVYRNDDLFNTYSENLNYSNNIASFSFNINILAELANYTFKIYGKQGNNMTLEKTVSNVVAGDVYIIQGQSNAEAMKRLESTSANGYQSDFIRVFASGTPSIVSVVNDNKWYIGQGDGYNATHGNTGQWGLKLANIIVNTTHIPVAIFNGAHGGKEIAFFQPPAASDNSLSTNYARLKYRLEKTGLKNYVRAVLWSQGETDADIGTSTEDYVNYFLNLKSAWEHDFPTIKDYYIFQTRIACGISIDKIMAIREAQRQLAANDSHIHIMQTAALTQLSDHCHFPFIDGYEKFADRIAPLVLRDIYNIQPSGDVEAPMITSAILTQHNKIIIETSAQNLQLNDFNSSDYSNFVIENAAQPSNVEVEGNKIIITVPQVYDHNNVTVSYLGEYSGTGHFITNSNGIELVCFNKFPATYVRDNDAEFISQSVPSSVAPGETFTVSLTFKNTGLNTWKSDSLYRLGSQDPQDNQIWGLGRVELPDSVPPNQTVTFTFNVTAPTAEGIYNFRWRMLREQVEWFGDKSKQFAISVVQNVDTIDASTLNNKVMFGYQGWFSAPGDGSQLNKWHHYFSGDNNQVPLVDLWPDVSEYDDDELFDTGLLLPDGSPAKVPSSYTMKTVKRHMKWLADYHLDGVFLQRFVCELEDPRYKEFRDQVLENVRLGCEDYGRVFAVMYDISSSENVNRFERIKQDWKALVDSGITNSPRYLRHNGLPVVAIWGIGFTHHGYHYTPDEAMDIINFFHNNPNPAYRATVMGGVPAYWRELTNDSDTDSAWLQVYESLDIISPWAVGRCHDEASADDFRANLLHPDKEFIDQLNNNGKNISYLPVAWPGFSWHNLQLVYGTNTPYNEIPRNGGRLFWRQAYNIIDEGINMIYIAMFDEIDEGTAMFKCAPTQDELPDPSQFSNGIHFVSLDVDGYDLESDFYLRLAGCTAKVLRGEEPLTVDLPTCDVYTNINDTTNKSSNISVYPNPLNTTVKISGVENGGYVTVYDVCGNKVLTEDLTNSNTVDFSTLPNGVYILNIVTDAGTTNIKVIKN